MKIDRICSIQGSAKENEDSVDYKNQYFWIIDGATDLFNAKDSIGYSVSFVINSSNNGNTSFLFIS